MTTQILSYNYAPTYSNLTVSSEAVGFPVSNAINRSRRTQVWRTNGYFKIVDGENTIVFYETAATPLTATITAGEYTSATDLATEIKTQLEAVGASTYSVTIETSTTGKFKISSNGAGGGGIFSLIWTSASSIGDILGYDTSTDDTGALTYLADTLRISTGEYLLFDFGMPINPDAIMISWRQDESNAIADDSTVTVKANPTNNFVTSVYSYSTPKSDYGFFLSKSSGSTGLGNDYYRYWQIEFSDISNPSATLEIGSIFIGDWIGFSRGQVQFPFRSSWEESTVRQVSDGGQVFASNRYITRQFSAEWFGLTKAEKERFESFFESTKTVTPFYIMLDPNEVLGSTVEQNVIYVRFDATPSWSVERPGVYSLNCSFREEI